MCFADILTGTPIWVWIVLAVLLFTGWRAMRTRRMTLPEIVILPLVFLGLSLRLPIAQPSLAAMWAVGMALGVAAGWWAASRSGAVRQDGAVLLPGTWIVLAVSLGFFAVQYWVGVLRATQPVALLMPPLSILVPVLAGATTGLAVGRAGFLLPLLRG